MNAKIIYVEAIIYLLYNLHDCTFNKLVFVLFLFNLRGLNHVEVSENI